MIGSFYVRVITITAIQTYEELKVVIVIYNVDPERYKLNHNKVNNNHRYCYAFVDETYLNKK